MWNAKFAKTILPLGLLLAACGGGGGSGSTTAANDIPAAAAEDVTTVADNTSTDSSSTDSSNTNSDSGSGSDTPSDTYPAKKYAVPTGCVEFYESDFQPTEGKDETPPAKGFARPVKGKPYSDPAYTTCVVRATDHEAEGLVGFARNDYSRRQPFNADDSKYLIYSQGAKWYTYDTESQKKLRELAINGGSTEPQWDPENPDLLYVLPNYGVGMTISTYDVNTDESKVVADLHKVKQVAGHPGVTNLADIWPSAYRAWTKGEGSPSADARYWAFMIETKDFQPLGMVTYDLETNEVVGLYDFKRDGNGIGRPDHLSMSPSGKYVVPSWNGDGVNCASREALGTVGNPCGLMAYSRDFSTAVGLAVKGPHSDTALDANGRDVIVAGDYETGWVEMWDLGTGENTRLWQIYEDGNSTAMHISGRNFEKPGWVLISTYMEKKPGWYASKMMAVELKAAPRILNIAHTYNTVETYFSETHGAVNRDFTKALFNSNWQTANMNNIDAYMATLPKNAVPYL